MLSYPFAVEVTGSSQNPAAEREDALPSDLYLRIEFVEMVCWPTWAYNGLDKESLAKRAKDLEQAEADRKAGKAPKKPEPAARR